ncbi:MAG: DUF1345 domain-containing protein [Methylobacteriaceae bacterium]|nr:DUF1345 domain-containing protein [Methylobacteriaceae bacterium]
MRLIQARPRLFICIAIGITVTLIQPHAWQLVTRLLIAWNSAVILYLILGAGMMMHADKLSIRRRAQLTDDGRYAFLGLSILAAIASFAAIVFELAGVKDLTGSDKAAHVALVAATIVSSWFFVHLTFTLHYAHEYFADELRTPDPTDVRGGLIFPGKNEEPRYIDFLYFSYIIGVASQTADVATSSRTMRALALVHGIVSFFFNTTILALTINIAASLL